MSDKQRGFTLVELMLSTALFSFILLFVTTGFIHVNRAYNKGATVKRIHQSAREVIDELTRAMLDSTSRFPLQRGTASYGDYDSEWLCIGDNVTYEWVRGYVEPQDQYFNLGRRLNWCGDKIGLDETYPRAFGQVDNLLDEQVAVQDIRIEEGFGAANTYRIVVKLATNSENTDFNAEQPCEPTDPYCDFVTLETVVTLRR